MKVSLIDYTGKFAVNPASYAARLLVYTKNTRLTQGQELYSEIMNRWPDERIDDELIYIANTIRSSWEFVDFTFQISGVSRDFTHQLVRTRVGVSFAQQSMRTVNMEDFKARMPQEIKDDAIMNGRWRSLIDKMRDFYSGAIMREIRPEDARAMLPGATETAIVMKINLRALADWLPKRTSARAQGEYIEVAQEVERLVYEAMPWTKQFIRPDRKATPMLDHMLKIYGNSGSHPDAIRDALKELDKLKETWG